MPLCAVIGPQTRRRSTRKSGWKAAGVAARAARRGLPVARRSLGRHHDAAWPSDVDRARRTRRVRTRADTPSHRRGPHPRQGARRSYGPPVEAHALAAPRRVAGPRGGRGDAGRPRAPVQRQQEHRFASGGEGLPSVPRPQSRRSPATPNARRACSCSASRVSTVRLKGLCLAAARAAPTRPTATPTLP